jgi:hypothetical protein
MTPKEFTIWLDGFLTNRDWTTIKETDIQTIKNELSKVDRALPDFKWRPSQQPPLYRNRENKSKVPYSTLCSCNPANGGSGICGCIQGNKLVDPDYFDKTNFTQSNTSELETLINLQHNIDDTI